MPLQQHPLSAAFPAMPPADFDALKADVAAHGQIEPGFLYDGMVLDGWHRYRACEAAGIEFEAVEFTGDPVAFVISRNAHRRHLNASQRAAAIVACAHWRQGAGRPAHVEPEIRNPVPNLMTEAEMASAAGVTDRTIRQAKEAERAGLGEAVRDGVLSAKRAAEIAKLPEPEREAAINEPAAKPARKKPEPAAEVEELQREKEEMRAQRDELAANLAQTVEDNESLAQMFEADDKLAEANRQIEQLRAENRVLRERLNGVMNEKNEAVRMAKSWQRKAEQAEKALAAIQPGATDDRAAA